MTETEYAPAWRPEAGQEVEGRVVQVDARESEYGVYPILTLEDEGGTQIAVHCIHSILRREIARRYEPTQIIGQPMKIRYVGKQTTKDGKRDFHNYQVFGGNRQAAYDWNQDLPPEDRPQVGSADPPMQSSFASVSTPAVSSAPAPVDLGPLPPRNEPSVQDRAAESFGEEVPF